MGYSPRRERAARADVCMVWVSGSNWVFSRCDSRPAPDSRGPDQVNTSLPANQRPVSGSRDHSRPIRGRCEVTPRHGPQILVTHPLTPRISVTQGEYSGNKRKKTWCFERRYLKKEILTKLTWQYHKSIIFTFIDGVDILLLSIFSRVLNTFLI